MARSSCAQIHKALVARRDDQTHGVIGTVIGGQGQKAVRGDQQKIAGRGFYLFDAKHARRRAARG